MEPMLRRDTRPEPARRRPAQEPPVQVEHVDEAPAEVRDGEPDVRFKEVQDTEDIHHQVDVRQDGYAVDDCDDAPTGGRDDQTQDRLFEDVTEVLEPNEGSARPKRSPKPNPK
jgi:hypothetical protein